MPRKLYFFLIIINVFLGCKKRNSPISWNGNYIIPISKDSINLSKIFGIDKLSNSDNGEHAVYNDTLEIFNLDQNTFLPELNFNIIFADSEDSLSSELVNLNKYLILSNKRYLNFDNQFVLDNIPINIFKLIEKINIEFLKIQFNSQSKFKVNNYIIDFNSREMFAKNIKLKLTEKEINIIIFLSKSNKPVSIDELEEKVWSYQSGIETHTVETHIYRLRKKILNTFKDNEFIISKKDGYQIN